MVPFAMAIGAGVAGVAATMAVARRESQARQLRTSRLLDECVSLFDSSRITLGADGFPRLDGMLAGRQVRMAAVPDTLTLKRLPQLWLQVTRPSTLPIDSDVALLARPTGAEFYALTHRMAQRLDVPAGLSPALLARGMGPKSQALLDSLLEPLSAAFAEPRLKELAVTRRGVRAVMQAREGQRGEYLLLRQSAFDGPVPLAAAQVALNCMTALETALLGDCRPLMPAAESVAV